VGFYVSIVSINNGASRHRMSVDTAFFSYKTLSKISKLVKGKPLRDGWGE